MHWAENQSSCSFCPGNLRGLPWNHRQTEGLSSTEMAQAGIFYWFSLCHHFSDILQPELSLCNSYRMLCCDHSWRRAVPTAGQCCDLNSSVCPGQLADQDKECPREGNCCWSRQPRIFWCHNDWVRWAGTAGSCILSREQAAHQLWEGDQECSACSGLHWTDPTYHWEGQRCLLLF